MWYILRSGNLPSNFKKPSYCTRAGSSLAQAQLKLNSIVRSTGRSHIASLTKAIRDDEKKYTAVYMMTAVESERSEGR